MKAVSVCVPPIDLTVLTCPIARRCRASCAEAGCRGSSRPSCVALGLRLSSRSYRPDPSQWERTDQFRPKNPPDGTAVPSLKASIPRPPAQTGQQPRVFVLFSDQREELPAKASPDGSHPARPKQKRTVCPHPDKPQAFVGSDAPRQTAKL